VNKSTQQGFTLIELIVVLVVLAVLAATLFPRSVEIADEAHRTSVQGTAGAYASAVILARSQWTAKGASGATENLAGFGRGNLNVSDQGWAVSVNGSTDPGSITAQDCVDLWDALLQSSGTRLSLSAGEGVEYQVSLSGGLCRYSYLKNDAGHFFEYDPEEGEVVTNLN